MARTFVKKTAGVKRVAVKRRRRNALPGLPVDARRKALYGSVSGLVLGVALFALGGVNPASAACLTVVNVTTCSAIGGPAPAQNLSAGDDILNSITGQIQADVGGFSVTANAGNDFLNFVGTTLDGAVAGNAGNDTIILTGSTATFIYGGRDDDDISSIGSTTNSIFGDRGSDEIYVGASQVNGDVYGDGSVDTESYGDTITIGSSTVTGSVYGDAPGSTTIGGQDEIDIRSLSALTGNTYIGGSVYGGADNDTLRLRADLGGAVYVQGGVEGGNGNDRILIDSENFGLVDIDEDVEGNDGNDRIFVSAESGGDIDLRRDIEGNNGNDWLIVTADGWRSDVEARNVLGGDGVDFISLRATDDAEIDVEDIRGGDDSDFIFVTADDDGSVEFEDIEGDGDGFGGAADLIVVRATNSGEIEGGDILGGWGGDTISVSAEDFGSDVDVDRIDGGWGDDRIFVDADENGDVDVNDGIRGSFGNDRIELTADDDGTIFVDDGIEGGFGNDTIRLVAEDDGRITAVDGDIEGNDGVDVISLFANRSGEINIYGDIEGGDDNDRIFLTSDDFGSDVNVRGDVEGGDGFDLISLSATDDGEMEVDDIRGGDDSDFIFVTADNDGSVEFDNLEGDGDGFGGAADLIVVRATNSGEIEGNDIRGGAGGDAIFVSAEDFGSDVDLNDIEGEDGDDLIVVSADEDGEIELDNIRGGDGADTIVVEADDDGSVEFNNIYGDGDGPGGRGDEITLTADEDGEIRGNDIYGGAGRDQIELLATRGGEIDVDVIDGGDWSDRISLTALFGGDIEVDEEIDGGDGDDRISLTAGFGGDITVNDIEGDEGDDEISLVAFLGGDIEVDDIEGGDGDDEIFIGAYGPGAFIDVDGDIEGGDDDDRVTLSNLDNRGFVRNFDLDGDLDGGRGFDRLVVTDGSDLQLDDVDDFEQLRVVGNSYLDLTQRYSNFVWDGYRDGSVFVGSTSYLRLSDEEADLDTERFVLDGPDGYYGYRSIDTGVDGGVLEATGGVLDVAGRSWNGPSDTRVEIENAYWNGEYGRFVNKGTIALHHGLTGFGGGSTDVTGDRFRINGDYEGGGNLLLDTYAFDSDSATDLFVIDGDVIDGAGNVTTIYVNNTNTGNGAWTGQGATDGIKVVDVRNGNYSPEDMFELATNTVTGQQEVIAGAYSYRLVQAPPSGGGEAYGDGYGDWYLQSGYLSQASGYATVSSAAQRHFFSGFDTLYKRIGELRQQDIVQGQNADMAMATKAPVYVPVPAPKFQLWGRGGGADLSYDVDSGWDFDQQTWGLQAGGDYTFDYNATRISLGAFGGYTWSDADVYGNQMNWFGNSDLSLDGWNIGAYATFRETGLIPGAGWYADIVGKVDFIDVDVSNDENAATASTDATVWGVSAELGYGFDVGNGFVIQPQAQLTYASVSQDSYTDSLGVYVSPDDAESLIGRLGLQVQTTIVGANGQSVTPWAVFNVLSEFMGDNETNVAGTILTSDIGGTWYNAGAGFSANLTDSVALFGSGEYNFGDVEGWAGSGGVKVRW